MDNKLLILLAIVSLACGENTTVEIRLDKPATDAPKSGKTPIRMDKLLEDGWLSIAQKDYATTYRIVGLCKKVVGRQAEEQRKYLNECPQDYVYENYMSYNDLAECFLILARAHEEQGNVEFAVRNYERIIEHYSLAQTGFPGFVSSPAQEAQERLKLLKK